MPENSPAAVVGMTSPNHRLDLLRREIDDIDVAIHQLIMKPGTIVEDIGKIKIGPAFADTLIVGACARPLILSP